MEILVYPKGFLLDEQKGSFTNDSGQQVEYHKARFYDTDSQTIYKTSVEKGAVLPPAQLPVTLALKVRAGERYCALQYLSFEE